MNLDSHLVKCYDFIIKRRKEDGGFSATPFLPPSVEDIYYSLKSLNVLEDLGLKINYNPKEDEPLRSWLFFNSKWTEPRVFYHFISSCRICDLYVNRELINDFLAFWSAKTKTLEKAYYLTKISDLIGFNFLKFNLRENPRVVREFFYFLYLSKKGLLRYKIEKEKLIDYFMACQNPDGGFGFYPNTTSFIENTYYCLLAFDFLNAVPSDLENIYNFILYCQTDSGGFARKHGASAFLDSTYFAVYSLKILLKWCG